MQFKFPNFDQSSRVVNWPTVSGAALPISIDDYLQSATAPLVVVCSDATLSLRLTNELKWLSQASYPVLNFPDWETLPYDQFSPHPDIISDRIRTLNNLPSITNGAVVVPATSLLQRLAPNDYIEGRALNLAVGETLKADKFRQRLQRSGYQFVETVRDHGQVAFRGSIIDIFPMGTDRPIRIDLFDDEIDELRSFDAETQITVDKVESVSLLPAHEIPLDRTHRMCFEERWHEAFPSIDFNQVSMYKDVISGISTPGLEYFLSLFFEETATIFDYLPDNCRLLLVGDVNQAVDNYWKDITERYQQFSGDKQRPILKPSEAFHPVEVVLSKTKQYPRAALKNINASEPATRDASIDARKEEPLAQLKQFIINAPKPIVISCDSEGQREVVAEQLRRGGINSNTLEHLRDVEYGTDSVYIMASPLEVGLVSQQPSLTLLTDAELYGRQVRQSRRRNTQTTDDSLIIRDLSQLNLNDPVVHIEHGIGRYLGLETLEIDKEKHEFVKLEYSGNSHLFLPVSALHLISRYSGPDKDHAPLHKLGSDTWNTAKRKAAEKAYDAAAELLNIYARREAKRGHKFPHPGKALAQFSAEFPYEETPDQTKAINAVVADMTRDQPMDRLICGDVGFGKTEVAMRAAFVAVHGGKQVAVLVPTTLLAQQHAQNFVDRFKDWPVKVEVVSRFQSTKAVNETLEQLKSGQVDILIGTHKLLQPDIKFDDLGLLIIDEEHRFGVRQKEQIKKLRAQVDILTMTATPIPRTLNLAMNGMRDLSIIATPPARRLRINTFVRERDNRLIKEAVLRELMRGGQVYFLHNDVQTIDRTAFDLQELIPEARVGIGHGQMRERELEQVMSDFYHRRTNVLVCTTIIETGIDVPNANTIIMDRADKLGIAQLHQLRGRVGRSHHQAYAYLITPSWKSLSKDAQRRLEAISETTELGAGFTLATHDLEIRGAGELLGDQQSGQIQSVGLTMYMDLLEQAVADLRAGRTPSLDTPLETTGEIDLGCAALIPDDYIFDTNERLVMYKRIGNATNQKELDQLQIELIDRFGLLPPQLKTLFEIHRIRQVCEALGVAKLNIGQASGKVIFNSHTQVEPLKLVTLVQEQPNVFKLQGANELRFSLSLPSVTERIDWAHQLLEALS